MRRDIRLVISDVDGTLVMQSKLLTARTIAAVRQLRNAGIAFTVASSRPPRGLRMLIDALGLTDPLAAFNGGVLIRPDLSVMAKSCVPAPVAAKVIAAIERYGLDCWVYTERDWLVRDPDAPHVAHEQWTVKFSPTVVSEFTSCLDDVAKIVGIGDDYAAIAQCETDLQRDCGDHVTAVRSQPYYLDVTHPDANKGRAVTKIAEALSISPAQIATIGDMPSDALMFQQSGVSIAMGNAGADVKRQAQFVTTSNEEEGFANAMEKFIFGEQRERAREAS